MSGSESTPPTPRRAARVIVLDATDRVLMFHGQDPANPADRYWLTAGGGIEDGEDAVVAASRELAEETGLVVAPADFGQPIWHDVTEFSFDGRLHRQEQTWFVVRVPSWEVDTSQHNDVERRSVLGHRWLTLADLATVSDPYYPPELPELLRRLGVR